MYRYRYLSKTYGTGINYSAYSAHFSENKMLLKNNTDMVSITSVAEQVHFCAAPACQKF
jgi:hypothetical protein